MRSLVQIKMKSPQVRDLDQLMREWPERGRKLRAQVTYQAASWTLADLLARIPSSMGKYKKSLDVAKVTGLGAGEDAFVVAVDTKRVKVKKVKGAKTLLYVKPNRRQRRTPDSVQVLIKHSPWTPDTIPFMPSKRVATVLSRSASKSEVKKVAEARQKHDEWKRELAKAGVRKIRKDHGLKVSPKVKALPVVSLEGIKLELGLGPDAKPHWKPAILSLKKRGLKQISMQDRDLRKALERSEFNRWRKWPTRTPRKVRIGQAKKYEGFQKRLGIRA